MQIWCLNDQIRAKPVNETRINLIADDSDSDGTDSDGTDPDGSDSDGTDNRYWRNDTGSTILAQQ